MALAAATLHEPKLLLLDEPTAGVDPQARREFWDEIHALAERGMTVLVSTHYMDEAERCHDIAYIFNGKLIARGTAEEMIAHRASSPSRRGSARRPAVARAAGKPGVAMVSPFGSALHVSGTDRKALEAAIAPVAPRSVEVDRSRAEPGGRVHPPDEPGRHDDLGRGMMGLSLSRILAVLEGVPQLPATA